MKSGKFCFLFLVLLSAPQPSALYGLSIPQLVGSLTFWIPQLTYPTAPKISGPSICYCSARVVLPFQSVKPVSVSSRPSSSSLASSPLGLTSKASSEQAEGLVQWAKEIHSRVWTRDVVNDVSKLRFRGLGPYGRAEQPRPRDAYMAELDKFRKGGLCLVAMGPAEILRNIPDEDMESEETFLSTPEIRNLREMHQMGLLSESELHQAVKHAIQTHRNEGAVKGKAVVGCVDIIMLGKFLPSFGGEITDDSKTWTYSYLSNMVVAKECQRQGVGLKLLRQVEEAARVRGATALLLHVEKSNTPAVNLYEVSGFTEVPEARSNPLDRWVRRHVLLKNHGVLMEKQI